MKTQKQRDEKRLKLLCRRNVFTWWDAREFTIELYDTRYADWETYPYYKEKWEIIQLFKKLKYTDIEANKFWYINYTEQRAAHEVYDGKPKGKKQDNKDYYNGSGGSNRNKIRYPKKCRKTAWKRFFKLFPSAKRPK